MLQPFRAVFRVNFPEVRIITAVMFVLGRERTDFSFLLAPFVSLPLRGEVVKSQGKNLENSTFETAQTRSNCLQCH
jgi:hypothetical protein